MKNYANFNQDGFPYTLETIQFLREIDGDQYSLLSSLIGTSTVFVSGGAISQASGNTTVTNGVIFKDGGFYTFTGGTYAGVPSDLKVLFAENTAAGYPRPKFEGDPVAKDIYLDKTASINNTGTVVLSTVGYYYNIQALKTKVDTLRTDVDALKTKAFIQYPLTGLGSGSYGYVNIARVGNIATISGFYTQGTTATTVAVNLYNLGTAPILSGFPTDVRWVSCMAYTSINGTTNLAQNPSAKAIGILTGGGVLGISLASTMAANTTVYFDITIINHL